MTPPVVPVPTNAAPPPPETGVDARAVATRMASIIAAGMEGRDPPAPGPGATSVEDLELVAPPAPAVAPVVPVVAPIPTPEEAAAAATAVAAAAAAVPPAVEPAFSDEQFGEAEQVLTGLGVDLGVDRATLAPELVPAYAKLVQSAIDLSQSELNERLSASDARRQLEDFGSRLEKEPDKLLLAIAVTQPEVMKRVIDIFQQMQTDEGYKDLVIREMQTDARDRDLSRREASLKEQDVVVKSKQVTTATKVVCRKLGIPFETGEKLVARAIKANAGKFEPADVEGVLNEVKGLFQKTPVLPRVASPAKVVVQNAAPAAPVAPTLAPSATPAPVPANTGSGGRFRSIVRDANARVLAAVTGR